jgi:hypothetical protein
MYVANDVRLLPCGVRRSAWLGLWDVRGGSHHAIDSEGVMALPVPIVYTAAQVAALRAALVSGTTKVSYGDKMVEYRSLAEIKEILAAAEANLNGVRRRRTYRTVTVADKGL